MNVFRFVLEWYISATGKHPLAVIIAVGLVCSVLISVAFTTNDMPNFNDPQVGFESRGSKLSSKLNAWNNLKKETQWNGPLKFTLQAVETEDLNTKQENENYFVDKKNNLHSSLHQNVDKMDSNKGLSEGMDPMDHSSRHFADGHNHLKSNGFCGSPDKEYAHFVFESSDPNGSLFSLENILSMCDLDTAKLRRPTEFLESCEFQAENKCCPSWSLSNYVAAVANKTSCYDITHEDAEFVVESLQVCLSYYQSSELSECLLNNMNCQKIPFTCKDRSLIFDILHYILDTNYLSEIALQKNITEVKPSLQNSLIFLPMAKSSKNQNYFRSLSSDLTASKTKIVAMDLGLREVVFDQLLMFDLIFVGISSAVIVLLMLIYTTSFFITSAIISSIFLSLGVSYFLYSIIFGIEFFPFINCMAIIICLGIGVDDAFIFTKIWNLTCKENPDEGDQCSIVRKTCCCAVPSMFVTSFTTAAAFFATYSSSITAIKCFSVYAGTAIIVHFIIILWALPSIFVLAKPLISSCNNRKRNSSLCILLSHSNSILVTPHQKFERLAKYIFSTLIPLLLKKFRYFWIFLYLTIFSLSVFTIYSYHHRLIPDSIHLQLLSSDHPFEVYKLKFAKRFSFEQLNSPTFHYSLPVRIVWGIQAKDNGDYLDPYNRGKLDFDDNFNISSKQSQKFLHEFCNDLRNQSFFKPTVGLHLFSCFIETFKSWMSRECHDDILKESYFPCCRNSSFPFEPLIFDTCLPRAIEDFYRHPGFVFDSSMPGPRFSAETGKVQVAVVEYETKFNFSLSYDKMKQFVKTIDTWLDSKLRLAPPGMRNGWFVSDFSFYDLQNSLLWGAFIAIVVASIISFVLIVTLTLSLRLSSISVTIIISIILAVLATIILIGWTLDIFQAIIISVLIGLAVDFVMHSCITYKFASVKTNRESQTNHSISRVGSPVTMSFVTTFIAGSFMLSSSVLVYIQIGIFLMLVSSISWLFSTFFLQSFLTIFGPVDKREINSSDESCN